ncbi:type 1 periplasmic-binding domain-containing protein [Methyloglobulus morosus]|uniref:hypothetical protein n=1 Tax=Methyloglobulus morosus TaxID=1410681 RepID=UPI00128EB43F|nr:hypothetical protein [Methyloglobulus morosus]
MLVIFGNAHAKTPIILIAYPAVEEPLHSIYASVIKGIEKKISHAELLEVADNINNLQGDLNKHHPDKIIALGKRVADAALKTTYRNQIVVGLVHSTPHESPGVSLALDSQELAKRLTQLAPFIKKVYAVQESSYPAITLYDADTPINTPPIIMKEGGDMVSTIRLLGQLVEQDATSSDAVLVPSNLPGNILFEITKIAWDRKIILLSTNLSHLESGVLMVFYPDVEKLGEQLGRLANNSKPGFENLQSVNAGLNQRIAQHLNIRIEASLLNQFSVKLK